MLPTEQRRFDSLFQKLLLALKLQGLSRKTIDCYSRAVHKTADYFDCCPDTLSKDQLKDYFSYLVDSRSWSTVKIARNALQFFYQHVLEKEWDWVNIVKPPKVKILPDILYQNEISRVLNAITKRSYRVFFLTVYSMGLRLEETLTLRPCDINAQVKQVHIRCSKGGKSRMVPLPDVTVIHLRQFWKTHRHPTLLFPRLTGDANAIKSTHKTLDRGSLQRAIKLATASCGIPRHITIRSLRHSYAYTDVGKGREQDAEALLRTYWKKAWTYVRSNPLWAMKVQKLPRSIPI